ncbi:hypothetical protein Tco_0110101 [Tanacetum coccineum]
MMFGIRQVELDRRYIDSAATEDSNRSRWLFETHESDNLCRLQHSGITSWSASLVNLFPFMVARPLILAFKLLLRANNGVIELGFCNFEKAMITYLRLLSLMYNDFDSLRCAVNSQFVNSSQFTGTKPNA